MSDEFEVFRGMREHGASAAACCLLAREAGWDFAAQISMLRDVFELSLEQAKEVFIMADGRTTSLAEHQERLLPALQEALRDL